VPETLVLLHGFSGTRRAWDGVSEHLDPERYLPLALDLPGHGEDSANTGPISFADCVERVLSHAPERFALCGYSLGGRVAMHVALAAPERVTKLIVISANPGIEDPRERAERRAADRLLADEMEAIPFEEFIERWRTQPLFAADPPAVGEMARADQRRNRPESLAAVLRGLGAGEMEPLWEELAGLPMPLTYLAGERDEKFVAIGRRVVALQPAARMFVLACGHGPLYEQPAAVALVLEGLDPEAGG
jgi:2-succinyl-6-hydroxy-2,4-cyclohexadiene-1-carboxylate synthase